MAVVVAWVHQLSIIAFSLSALCTVIIFLIFCVCWGSNHKRFKHIYMFHKTIPGIDVNHPKRASLLTTTNINNEENKIITESPDSSEVDTRSFDHVKLVIEDTDIDAVSCISSESITSFFSVKQGRHI